MFSTHTIIQSHSFQILANKLHPLAQISLYLRHKAPLHHSYSIHHISTRWFHPHLTQICIKSVLLLPAQNWIHWKKQIASLAAGLRKPEEQKMVLFLPPKKTQHSSVSVCLHRYYLFVKAAFSGVKCQKILKWLNWHTSMNSNRN